MAKPKIPNQKTKYNELNKRLSDYVALVRQIYDALNLEAAKMAERVHYNGEKPFRFGDYPQLRDSVLKLKNKFSTDMQALIYTGTSREWKESNLVQDLVADKVLKAYGAKVNGQKYKIYYQTNSDALKAFQTRKDNGMSLSKKLWNQATNYREELEFAISSAIQKGTSAVTLSKRISKYLQDFDLLQKDYKQKYGKAVTCNDCEYRSIRLARSEINMAYRTAEQKRWEQMDFVVGYEIKLSHAHHHRMPHGDICDELAGKYPKDFKWTGWHPNDMCYVVPILKTEEEFWADDDVKSKNEVSDTPQQFKDWVRDNKERIKKAKSRGTLPYFVKDNPEYTKPKKSIKEIAEERHAKRDEAAIRQAARNRNLLDVAEVDNRMIAKLRSYAKEYEVDIEGFNDYIYSHKFKESFDMITDSENQSLENLYQKYEQAVFDKVKDFDKKKSLLKEITLENYEYGNLGKELRGKIDSVNVSNGKTYSQAVKELDDLKNDIIDRYERISTSHIPLNAKYKEFKPIDFNSTEPDLEKYQKSMELLSNYYGPTYSSSNLYRLIDAELNKSRDFGKAVSIFKEEYDNDLKYALESINKLSELKIVDISKIHKSWLPKFNDYITAINAHDFSKGYNKIYRQIEGAYNIFKLSTDKRCIKYGLDKISMNTPFKLIDEYSKIFKNPFSNIAEKAFYDGFENFVPAVIRSTEDAYYATIYGHVNLGIGNRVKNAVKFSKYIQYHEFGHAMDSLQGGWRYTKEWNDLFDKYAAKFNKDKIVDAYGKEIVGAKLKDKYWDAYVRTKQTFDDEEIAGALSDVLVSFDNKHEWFGLRAHSADYFKEKNSCLAEFIAHACENYWLGNPIFAKVYPTLYKEMKSMYKKYFDIHKTKRK